MTTQTSEDFTKILREAWGYILEIEIDCYSDPDQDNVAHSFLFDNQ